MLIHPDQTEARDAEQVDQARVALAEGDIATAEALLLDVIANTPIGYTNSSEDADDGMAIKFWDLELFTHYIMWEKQQGRDRNVRWLLNAYPRAHYYMGFLCVQTGRNEDAVGYLERGRELEPTNPLFNFELAHALGQTKDRQRALELYDAVKSVGPHVTAHHVGVARRGCGFVLAELGRLEEAAAAYRSSLEFAPGNSIALDELEYIEHLQKGGNAAPGRAVQTQSPGLTECAMCGGPLGDGLVVSVKDQPRFVCDTCREKRDGKWWQFWK